MNGSTFSARDQYRWIPAAWIRRVRTLPMALALLLRLALLASGLASGVAHAATEFLDPADAFRIQAKLVAPDMIEVHYKIADGYYLYRERFRFSAESGATLGTPVFPTGEIKYDETFKKNVEHYRHDVTIRIPVQAHGTFTLVSTAQGCADAGLCYPPQETRVQIGGAARPPLDLFGNGSTAAAGGDRAAATGTSDETTSATQMARVDTVLHSGNLLMIALFFAGWGLLLAFTPCVLPMVPILSSIIAGDARMRESAPAEKGRLKLDARGFALALDYSLGMALVYTGLGVAAGLAGEGLAAALQRPEVLFTFAAILVVLALSMFDLYQLQMPHFVQSRLHIMCSKRSGGRFLGVFVMGALSALIVGPCVAAPLAGALLFISQTRNTVIGGTALFSMAIGMSVPLLVVGASEGVLLPRAGKWMEAVKKFFGVMLIGVAIWMVQPVTPMWFQMLAWGGLLVILSVYLHVFDPLPAGAPGWSRFWKGVGVFVLLLGGVQILGVATGGRDVLQPLGQLAQKQARESDAVLAQGAPVFEKVRTADELNARLHQAGKPVLLAFSAAWCVSCKEMEKFTFTDPRVAERMGEFVLLEADVTDNTPADKELLERFSLFGPPGIIFFDAAGKPVPGAQVVGFEDAGTFLVSLGKALS